MAVFFAYAYKKQQLRHSKRVKSYSLLTSQLLQKKC